jgi:hypothetical protein
MKSRDIVRHLRALALLLVTIAVSSPVLAAPALFAGTLTRNPPGPYVSSSPGPTTGSPGVLSVTGSSPATFTLPAYSMGLTFTNTTSFPGYPYFKHVAFRPILTGAFFAGGAPTGTTTVNPNVTTPVFPTFSLSPRQGFLRLIPGTPQFGGTARHYLHDDYLGTRAGTVGYYNFNITVRNKANGGPLGTTSFATTGTRVHTSLTGLTGHSPAARTGAPWITGSVTAYAPAGYYITTRTNTGVDNRTPSGLSGTISLVTPSLLHAFVTDANPTNIIAQAGGFAYWTKIDLVFLPEPSQVMLLACGIAGLFALHRLRRR